MSTATVRILLTDAAVKREPFAQGKPRIIRDSKVPGLHVWIGKRKKTFRYQYEAPRVNGQRGATLIEWLGEHPHHSADEARAKALAIQAARIRGEPVRIVTEVKTPTELAFGQTWEHYKAAITKEGKSPRTIADYQDKFDKHLTVFKDKALAAITREEVTRQHATITERARKVRKGKYASGKYAANGSMRLARAVWNFAKNELETQDCLSSIHFAPASSITANGRASGMGAKDLPAWWSQLQQLPNPIRREMHLFMLLSGLRRQDVLTARWDNLDEKRKALRIPAPKGGVDRAFDLPLSDPMLACLKRAKEAGNTFFPEQSRIWVFPAETGHVAEVKEDGKVKLSHTGHTLRHSFRTLAAAAGIDRLRLKILMNHALDRDVTDSYTNVPALFDSLMDAQQKISAFIITNMVVDQAKCCELSI